jgi:hypothetical protein
MAELVIHGNNFGCAPGALLENAEICRFPAEPGDLFALPLSRPEYTALQKAGPRESSAPPSQKRITGHCRHIKLVPLNPSVIQAELNGFLRQTLRRCGLKFPVFDGGNNGTIPHEGRGSVVLKRRNAQN